MITEKQKQELLKELNFNTSRSSGPGGQHVNKVNTKVELRFDVNNSFILSDYQKAILNSKLQSRLSSDHLLIIISQASRSQLKNKNEAIRKFFDIINKALTPVKKRKPTKPTFSSKQKRINDKKLHSLKKNLRRNIDF